MQAMEGSRDGHSEREREAAERRGAPADTSDTLLLRAQAVQGLVTSQVRVAHERITQGLEEIRALEWVIAAIQSTQASVKAKLLRTYLAGPRDVWPHPDPDSRAGEGEWPYDDVGKAIYPGLQDLEPLDLASPVDTRERRDAWRVRVEGPPPWSSRP